MINVLIIWFVRLHEFITPCKSEAGILGCTSRMPTLLASTQTPNNETPGTRKPLYSYNYIQIYIYIFS